MNGLKSSRYIKAGWTLKIPAGRAYASIKKTSPIVPAARIKGKFLEYVVRKGDSLWKIANRFGTTTKTIQSLNQLNNTHLKIGQVLVISRDLTATEKIDTKNYKVLKGDSPYIIAQKHQMNLSEFLRLNSLTPRSTIFPGQILIVKAE